ncbi:hypothetical protein PF010_g28923 [Phytophthora fragariae]|uniref:NADH:flavin oxidoreductase/NADH oxidase N-terminal domain-containing protein n=1 Tax=Phytophthora fragariae TaxID=53985 RepID=A0A6A3VUG5_9STRA|nr:hypothetical protein PF010_g28923 [Phytophthora fragariae]KAE9171673.1 hypothetical protein PF002_g29768 [Phytophthora fragariae]
MTFDAPSESNKACVGVAPSEAEAPSTLDGRVRSCAVVLGGDTPEVQLLHRVVMAPLTLQRTGEEAVQTALGVEYYQQRATPGGRITAKATNITPTGRGSWGSPGIFASEKVEAWRHVTKAVRDKGGKMFLQLWHTGRIGPPLNQPGGILPVSSSSKLETIHAGKKISAVRIVEDSAADTVAIGRHFISNPDLMWRFQLNKPLNDFNADSFYLADARVYTDYPFLE